MARAMRRLFPNSGLTPETEQPWQFTSFVA
jgi:hypothetical protein